jgi:hypothetical protein
MGTVEAGVPVLAIDGEDGRVGRLHHPSQGVEGIGVARFQDHHHAAMDPLPHCRGAHQQGQVVDLARTVAQLHGGDVALDQLASERRDDRPVQDAEGAVLLQPATARLLGLDAADHPADAPIGMDRHVAGRPEATPGRLVGEDHPRLIAHHEGRVW